MKQGSTLSPVAGNSWHQRNFVYDVNSAHYSTHIAIVVVIVSISDSTRLLFATWWIFITILTSFYTANLTAFLTLSQFTLPINDVEDIVLKNKHFVSLKGGLIEYAIMNVRFIRYVLQFV